MSSQEEDVKQVNIGKVPTEVAIILDNVFDQFCILLRKHGREIIPKKMLYPAAIWNYLNPALDLGRKEAQEEAIKELLENVKEFWKKMSGQGNV